MQVHVTTPQRPCLKSIFRQDKKISDLDKIFKIQNLILDFKSIQMDFQEIEFFKLS